MDTAQWRPQGIGIVKQQEVVAVDESTKSVEKKARPEKEQALNCPRCNSTNTKFCYYNNYSLSQPRYFCKTCRRYWTEGGSLRSVPVGGGSRKNNKRSSSSINCNNSNTPSKKISLPDPKIHQPHDLNLAYNPPDFINGPISQFFAFDPKNPNIDLTTTTSSSSVMELFKTAGNIMTSDHFNPLHDHQFKPSLGFSLDGIEINGLQDHHDANNPSRILFPFEDLKNSSTNEFDQQQDKASTGYWSGMLAGGSW